MKSTIISMLSAAALFAATAALAGETATQAQTKELKDAKGRLTARASGEKGCPRMRLEMERVRIGNLIDDLEAGRQVDPQEIDQALKRANQTGC